jgi:hypothetical protein
MDMGKEELVPVVGIYTGYFLEKVENGDCVPV